MGAPRQSSDSRRTALIAAALPAFAQAGLHGTAVSAVTDAVGITQPYAFSLFGTKKGLFLAAVEHCFDMVADLFRTAALAAPAEGRVHAMARAYDELLQDRTVLQFQLQCYASAGDPEVREVVARRMAGLFDLFQEVGGMSVDEARTFLATGMLCNLSVMLELPQLLPKDLGDDC